MMDLTIDDIITIHDKIIDAIGGSKEIPKERLLQCALIPIDAYYAFEEGNFETAYPTAEEIAASSAHRLICYPCFKEGNIQTGILVMFAILKLNGIRLKYDKNELSDLANKVLSINEEENNCVDDFYDVPRAYQYIYGWIIQHKSKR